MQNAKALLGLGPDPAHSSIVLLLLLSLCLSFFLCFFHKMCWRVSRHPLHVLVWLDLANKLPTLHLANLHSQQPGRAPSLLLANTAGVAKLSCWPCCCEASSFLQLEWLELRRASQCLPSWCLAASSSPPDNTCLPSNSRKPQLHQVAELTSGIRGKRLNAASLR